MNILGQMINSTYGDGFCSYDSIAIEYNVSGGTPGYNLSWSLANGIFDHLIYGSSAILDTLYLKVPDDANLTLIVSDTASCTKSDTARINILKPAISTTPLCYIDVPLTSDFCVDSFETGTLFDWRFSNPLDSLIYGNYAIFDSIVDSCVQAHFEHVDSGDFVFKVEVNDTAKGCLDTLQFTFVKDSSVSVDLIAQDSFICYGGQELLSVVGDSLDLSYLWINNTIGDTLPNTSRQISVSPIITTEYKVVVLRHGCSFEDSLIVDVNPLLDVDVGADLDICIGDIIALSPDTSANGISPLVFNWTPGIYTEDSVMANTKAFPIDTTDFVLSVTDSMFCVITDTLRINVTNLQLGLGNDTLICAGDSFTFNVDTANLNGSAPYTFNWTPNDSLSNPNISNPLSLNMDSLQIKLTVEDGKGCLITDSMQIDVIHFEIEIGIDTTLCLGDSFMINTDTAVFSGVSPINYAWNTSLGLSDSSIADPMFNGLDSIKLILSAQDALGCQAYDSIYVNVVNINLDLGLDVAVCAGDSFSFNIDSNVFNANVPYQYEWTSAINVTDATSLNPIA